MTAAPPKHADIVLEAAHNYISNGISVVPVPPRQKKPVLDGWQNLRLSANELTGHFRGGTGIGILTGEPSGNLIDNDLDVPEAIQAAAVFMPPTGRVHGRKGKPHSHRWYRVPDGIKTTKFQYPEGGNRAQTMYLELRSTGCQTLVWPSYHPTGEQYRWEQEDKPATVDANVILAAASKTAACTLLARHWGGPGSRDDSAMALCGMLLRVGWSEEATDEFVMLVAELAGDEEWRDRGKAKQTAAKLAVGEHVTGAPALAELLRDGERVVSKVREWLGICDQAQEQQDTITWDDEPALLPDGMPPVERFAMELLPTALRGWVWDVAERMQAPAEFPAVAAMVALAAVVGRQIAIHPKEHDDWLVVPNLWGAIVGRPSTMKTPSLEEGLKPLSRLVAEASDEYARGLADFDKEMLKYTAKKAAHEVEVKKAARESWSDAQLDDLIAQAPERPIQPINRRYRTNDATVEKLGELLRENPNGLLQFRDELTGWLRRLDEVGHEPDRAFYLEAFNGNGSHEVDRIGRGSLYIPALCLSLLGGIQPGPLASYVYDASTDGSAGNDGLLQRFQLLVWPDEPKAPWKNVDRYPDTEAKNTAYAVYKRLSVLDTAAIGAVTPKDEHGNDEPGAIPEVRFTPEGQALFNEWRNELEQRLRSREMAAPLEAHVTKYRSLLPSLALLFHLVDMHAGNEASPIDADTEGKVVSAESVLRAAAWCAYLESHAKRLYAHAEDPGLERARALLERIKAGEIEDGVAVYQILRHHWSRLTMPDELNDAIKTLEVFGWVQIQAEHPHGKMGRPSPRLRFHPNLSSSAKARRAA